MTISIHPELRTMKTKSLQPELEDPIFTPTAEELK